MGEWSMVHLKALHAAWWNKIGYTVYSHFTPIYAQHFYAWSKKLIKGEGKFCQIIYVYYI